MARRSKHAEQPEQIGEAVDQVVEHAQAQPEATVENGHGQSVERRYPNPRGCEHDNNAGVQRLTYSNKEEPDPRERYAAWLRFRDGKPSDEVRQYMKDHGFKWKADREEAGVYKGKGAWTHPIGYTTGSQDRLHSERVYNGVVDLILKEKGIERQIEEPSR